MQCGGNRKSISFNYFKKNKSIKVWKVIIIVFNLELLKMWKKENPNKYYFLGIKKSMINNKILY